MLPTQHKDVLLYPAKRIIVCPTNHTYTLVSPIRTTTSVHVFLWSTDNTVLIFFLSPDFDSEQFGWHL